MKAKAKPAKPSAPHRQSISQHLRYSLGTPEKHATLPSLYEATALAVRDHLIDKMMETEARYEKKKAKRVYYLSLEFLMGRSLGNNLYNLGLFEDFAQSLTDMGADIDEVRAQEHDAALGNGGLGRLAACFLDSMATLGLAGYGYGINYEFGLFKQEIDNGYQKEKPDNWLGDGTPWQITRPQEQCIIPVYGRIVHAKDRDGNYNPMWMDWKTLIGVPHDMPVAGYGGNTVNTLRLYAAKSSDDFDMDIFNTGDYLRAVEQKMTSETVSKVLYPSDAMESGRELRLVQEYFFVACAIRDIVNRHLKNYKTFNTFADRVAIQLNDTHPALAVAELMRLLVDEHALSWDRAWTITRATFAYTNHTLLPEALEKWPVGLMEYVLPRHMQIIFEINHRFLDEVKAKWPGDTGRLAAMSIIEESHPRQVRMAHLAIIGSHSVNGVAALHSELVKTELLPDFYALYPKRFNNKTNGVTPRRWLYKANPDLTSLITRHIGDSWVTQMDRIADLAPLSRDAAFQDEFAAVKRANKEVLAQTIWDTCRLTVSPDSLFTIHAKRIHEYKRQLLCLLHIIHQYLEIAEGGKTPEVPRTYIFAGKAAPGYEAAKRIIKLINSVAETVNSDERVGDALKVAFIPDYRVSLAEKIIPAADLSVQISTAGKEASGTGNMKFAMNGALTIGTLDGANIEIMEEVGEENIFIFGLTAGEVQAIRASHNYRPWEIAETNPAIKRVLDALGTGRFSPDAPGRFIPVCESLLSKYDPYLHLADLSAYITAQEQVEACYATPDIWMEKAILNVARMGKFSSDRTIMEYAKDIWNATPQV
ncbi:glycogen/starch/alpha-glucan phosphorylase [Desulfoluna butyratoxydans]|uniref:Alpha-1,4 glucan phosphorylase n=1 Tax=Desulfoluna butyratoxydans TaxID=231438 RepID=A0A4U8YI42_9BACT|nr:glycogen/starch/alpha-glucan phosphorylase [Desulfoluna butyratoxydans]VFQ42947.1 glycogen/starch/alpha-glucan phosphorylase [Desulfoluna butyratoxydans]